MAIGSSTKPTSFYIQKQTPEYKVTENGYGPKFKLFQYFVKPKGSVIYSAKGAPAQPKPVNADWIKYDEKTPESSAPSAPAPTANTQLAQAAVDKYWLGVKRQLTSQGLKELSSAPK